jgi:hypothetical protein
VLVITQPVFFLHETSQGRASPDEPCDIILNFNLEIPFQFGSPRLPRQTY